MEGILESAAVQRVRSALKNANVRAEIQVLAD
jgi:hypothetical protein